MDKEQILALGLQVFDEHPYDEGHVVSPTGYTWIDDQLIEFASKLLESYKADLLKGVGEPVLYAEFTEDGGWLGNASEYADHLKEPHALFTSYQLAAAQLQIKTLREALSNCLVDDPNKPFVTLATWRVKEALSIPRNTSALDAYVAKKMKEAIASFVDTTATYDTSKEIAEAIRRGAWKAFK